MPPTIQLKIDVMYGRLYVTGPSMQLLAGLPGAAINAKRRAVELSLTLEMVRAMRQTLGISKAQFASYCTPKVLS